MDGQLDQALSHAENREIFRNELSVGFARLSNSRTTIIIDAAPPPIGKPSFLADASTLAFEMVSGQRRFLQVVVLDICLGQTLVLSVAKRVLIVQFIWKGTTAAISVKKRLGFKPQKILSLLHL